MIFLDISSKCREDANRLANRLKKITLADVIESMTVTVEPFSLLGDEICRLYKLEMKLHEPLDYDGIELEDFEDTIMADFIRGLEDAIEYHVKLLTKINGIKEAKSVPLSGEEDLSSNRSQLEEENADDGEDDGEIGEGSDDLGLDAQKQKWQVTDEMDYEDDSEEQVNEEDPSAGSESENENGKNDVEFSKDDEIGILEAKDGTPESPSRVGNLTKSKSTKEKTKSRAKTKKRKRRKLTDRIYDRRKFFELRKFNFMIHFRITEAHILLDQVLSYLLSATAFILFRYHP